MTQGHDFTERQIYIYPRPRPLRWRVVEGLTLYAVHENSLTYQIYNVDRKRVRQRTVHSLRVKRELDLKHILNGDVD